MIEYLTIGEVARRAGVRPSTLRYYEEVNLLPAPQRVSGQRRYAASVLDHLALIQLAKQGGFTIAEIQTLLHGFETGTPPSARWRALAEQKLPQVEALIHQAQQMKRVLEMGLACHCLRFEECLIVEGEGCCVGQESEAAPDVRTNHAPT